MSSFDLKPLEQAFQHNVIKESFDGMYQCMGFISAIASSPDQVKPSEWIKQLIKTPDKSPQFESEEQAKSFSSSLIAWWSRCITLFDHGGTLELPPKLGITPGGKPNKALIEFAKGYLKGYNWLSKTWQTMLPENNPEAIRSLSVLNFILARFVNEKETLKTHAELFEQLPDLEGCFKALPGLISAVGMLGKDIATSSVQVESDNSSAIPIKNATRSIGRNDTCPCGSGKKFKKCCLH